MRLLADLVEMQCPEPVVRGFWNMGLNYSIHQDRTRH